MNRITKLATIQISLNEQSKSGQRNQIDATIRTLVEHTDGLRLQSAQVGGPFFAPVYAYPPER